MLDIRMVWESVGLLWRRLHRSPWRHAPIWVGVRGGGGEDGEIEIGDEWG